jgi:hypothetical protein
MLSIYASAMQTATRTDRLSVRSILPGAKSLRLRWWQRARTSCIDLSRL